MKMALNHHELMMEINQLDFSHPDLYKIILEYTIKSQQFEKNMDSILGIWENTDGPSLPQKTQSILALTYYLFFVEGMYALCLDVIVYYLIKSEHADILDRNGTYVTKFEKMTNVDLSRKCHFLERHGYKEVLTIVNRRLRNAIAHHDFNIHDDGTIEYKSKKGTEYASRRDIYEMIGNIRLVTGYIKNRRAEALRIDSELDEI